MPPEGDDPRLAALALAPAVPAARREPPPPTPAEPDAEPLALDLVIDLSAPAFDEPETPTAPPPLVVIEPSAEAEPQTAPAVAAAPPRPALPPSREIYRTAVWVGMPPRRAELAIEELGLRVIGPRELAVPWADVAAITEHRGTVRVGGREGTIAFRLDVDGIPEPTLAAPFARVLEEARRGTLDLGGTAFNALVNTTDALPDRFHETEDPLIVALLGAVVAALTLTFALVIPEMLRMVTQATVTTGGVLMGTRVSPLDPRMLVAGLGAAGLLGSIAMRAALGPQAAVWARGALRGWPRLPRPVRAITRGLAALMWAPALGGAMLVAGVVLALPSARVQTIVDASGVLSLRELPVFDSHRSWALVSHIVEIPAPLSDQHPEGVAVVIHFTEGSPLSTYDLTLRNATDRLLYDVAQRWQRLAVPTARP